MYPYTTVFQGFKYKHFFIQLTSNNFIFVKFEIDDVLKSKVLLIANSGYIP